MSTFDPELLDAIEALPTRDVVGDVWRHMFGDNSPELSNTRGARWNPRGVEAIYVSLERGTAIAEGQHAIDVQPLRPKAKRTVYRLKVEVRGLIDLTAAGALETVGLSREDIKADDFTACQAVGGAIAWLGGPGMIVPSARSDGSNVVILVNGLDPDSVFERISDEVIE